mgnify:CR=1 FL=1
METIIVDGNGVIIDHIIGPATRGVLAEKVSDLLEIMHFKSTLRSAWIIKCFFQCYAKRRIRSSISGCVEKILDFFRPFIFNVAMEVSSSCFTRLA